MWVCALHIPTLRTCGARPSPWQGRVNYAGGYSGYCGRSSVISNHGALLATKQCSAGRAGGSSSSASATPYCGEGFENSAGGFQSGPLRLMIGEPHSPQNPR